MNLNVAHLRLDFTFSHRRYLYITSSSNSSAKEFVPFIISGLNSMVAIEVSGRDRKVVPRTLPILFEPLIEVGSKKKRDVALTITPSPSSTSS